MEHIYLISQALPIIGVLGLIIGLGFNQRISVNLLMLGTALGLMSSITGIIVESGTSMQLSMLLSSFILFVCLNIQRYSSRYMSGDKAFKSYFIKLGLITLTANSMVLANSDTLFWICWAFNNLLLASLMTHKGEWQAAKRSGLLTALTLSLGSVMLGIALILLHQNQFTDVAKIMIVLAAVCQSAIWPFHRWLLSSLNSPTPVSALMHAGIVNGGGILLVKYNSLFIHDVFMLNLLFGLGLFSAVVAGFCKLIQIDIKKMLANSTMAQMGFMMMQCGLGLYPAAVAHLCWHGLFKAYLFLNSGSALSGKYHGESVKLSYFNYFWIGLASVIAVFTFCYTAQLNLNDFNTQWFLVGIVAFTAFQLSKGLVGKRHIILDMFMVTTCAGVYGLSLHLIESCFNNSIPFVEFNMVHLVGLMVFMLLWLVLNSQMLNKIKQTQIWQHLYLICLNSSQPNVNTISAIRREYRFK